MPNEPGRPDRQAQIERDRETVRPRDRSGEGSGRDAEERPRRDEEQTAPDEERSD